MRRLKSKTYDDLDYQIILALHADARMPAADIARKVGANERTVRKRIQRLIDTKAIRPTVIVEPDAFDYVTATDIFLEVDPKWEQEIIARLLSMQNVSYLAYGQGTGEISIEARFKNNEEFRQFLAYTLPSINNLKVKGYALVPRILKNLDDWLPKKEDFHIS
ncbi:MAG: Lrp/AsnC family transcriptional regulator [Anaerolineae bacterium]|nr:Lrp/AsnC family transcriptional regulator [Anaerolineae bacterium]